MSLTGIPLYFTAVRIIKKRKVCNIITQPGWPSAAAATIQQASYSYKTKKGPFVQVTVQSELQDF